MSLVGLIEGYKSRPQGNKRGTEVHTRRGQEIISTYFLLLSFPFSIAYTMIEPSSRCPILSNISSDFLWFENLHYWFPRHPLGSDPPKEDRIKCVIGLNQSYKAIPICMGFEQQCNTLSQLVVISVKLLFLNLVNLFILADNA